MIERAEALLYHAELVKRFGGSHGVRDEGILDAALNRPFATFGGEDLFPTAVHRAAAIMHGIITGHPFIDGNKRTGFVAAELFLRLNGQVLGADDASCVLTMLAVAAGDMSEEGFAAWLRMHSAARA